VYPLVTGLVTADSVPVSHAHPSRGRLANRAITRRPQASLLAYSMFLLPTPSSIFVRGGSGLAAESPDFRSVRETPPSRARRHEPRSGRLRAPHTPVSARWRQRPI